jgi:hypothetical protein
VAARARLLWTHLCILDDARVLEQQSEEHAGPVGAVADETQVRERLLGMPRLFLDFAELVTEFDQETTESTPLMTGQREDARKVVAKLAVLLLAVVAHHVVSVSVTLRHYVVKEKIHVMPQRLVVQEHLGDETEVLAVGLFLAAIELPHADAVGASVDLVTGRVAQAALGRVVQQLALVTKKFEAELADVQRVEVIAFGPVFWRERREIPCVDAVQARRSVAFGGGGGGGAGFTIPVTGHLRRRTSLKVG